MLQCTNQSFPWPKTTNAALNSFNSHLILLICLRQMSCALKHEESSSLYDFRLLATSSPTTTKGCTCYCIWRLTTLINVVIFNYLPKKSFETFTHIHSFTMLFTHVFTSTMSFTHACPLQWPSSSLFTRLQWFVNVCRFSHLLGYNKKYNYSVDSVLKNRWRRKPGQEQCAPVQEQCAVQLNLPICFDQI